MGGSGSRRLVLLAYYYPPLGGAGSLRALSFARHLPALGWQVTVVTPRDGVYGEDPSLDGESLPGVEILRTGTWEPAVLLRRLRGRMPARGGEFVEEARVGRVGAAIRSAVRRSVYFPDSARGWVRSAVAAARRAARAAPIDAVLSSSPPVSAHLAARDLAEDLRIPWIADWRDPWVESLESGHRHAERARALQVELLRRASVVVAATEGLAALLGEARSRGPAPVTVRNGFEPSDFEGLRPAAREGPPEIVFAGTHYGARQDLGAFLAAAVRLRKRRPLRLRFLGKVDPSLPAAARLAGLGADAVFEGFATHEDSIRAMVGAAALLLPVWSEDTRRGRLVCPAKTWEYLAAGPPVLALALPRSEASGLLAQFEGVRVHRFDDGPGIEASLEGMLAGIVRRPGGGDDLGPFTRAEQARALARAIDGASADGRAP